MVSKSKRSQTRSKSTCSRKNGKGTVQCDGPCGKMRSVQEMTEFGRCDHIICSKCLKNSPHFDQTTGTTCCPCYATTSAETTSKELIFEEFFLGALRKSKVKKHLKTNEFRLYYMMPKSKNEIPISLPLQLVYKSTRGKVYHFPIKCTNPGAENQNWHVITGRSSILSFDSLSSLVNYYKTYSYFDVDNGEVDAFPVQPESSSVEDDYENAKLLKQKRCDKE